MTWRMVLAALLPLLATLSAMAQQPVYDPTFVSDERIHDFGTIDEAHGPVSHTFTFTNKGAEPVAVDGVRVGCGCVKATFSRRPVPAGGRAKVTLTYDPAHRPGHFSKEAVVLLAGGRRFTRVWVKGDVVPMQHPVEHDHPYALGEGLYVSQTVLPFRAMQPGERDSIRVLVANATSRPMTVVMQRSPDVALASMPRRLHLQPGQRSRFYVRYEARCRHASRLLQEVVPVVNGVAVRPLRITWLPNSGE